MPMLHELFVAIPGQWEKVIATFFLIAVGAALSHLWARYLVRGEISAEKRRMHLVWARNVIWFLVFFVIISVWASTIAGFALSLAGRPDRQQRTADVRAGLSLHHLRPAVQGR